MRGTIAPPSTPFNCGPGAPARSTAIEKAADSNEPWGARFSFDCLFPRGQGVTGMTPTDLPASLTGRIRFFCDLLLELPVHRQLRLTSRLPPPPLEEQTGDSLENCGYEPPFEAIPHRLDIHSSIFFLFGLGEADGAIDGGAVLRATATRVFGDLAPHKATRFAAQGCAPVPAGLQSIGRATRWRGWHGAVDFTAIRCAT